MNVWDILSMLGSLALIALMLVLTWFFTRWYARRMGGGSPAGRSIQVLEKAAMGVGSSLAIVKVGDKIYLLGIGDKTVTMLAELPEDFESKAMDAPPPASFSQVLRQFTDRSRDSLSKKDDGNRDEGK